MIKDDQDDLSAERQALTNAKSALVESAATEVVNAGRLLFKDGEPNDPALQRRDTHQRNTDLGADDAGAI